jgi:guanylate kinase
MRKYMTTKNRSKLTARARGLLVVLSSPSGAGKTTVAKALLAKEPNLVRSVSCTTRPRRPGEKDGRDYFFISKNRFETLRCQGEFLEWARVFDNFYGTPKAWVKDRISRGKDVLFVIDIQGARTLRRKRFRALTLFLKPPSWSVLKKRLSGRRTETPETLVLRLKTAKREMAEASLYDYRVMNDRLGKAVKRIRRILALRRRTAQRNLFTASRQPGAEGVNETLRPQRTTF